MVVKRDIRERLKEIEESLRGDLPDIKIAERYKENVEKTNVDKLLNAFEKIKDRKITGYSTFYEISSDELNSINYSLKDIEDLSLVIKGDEDKIGIYISAAINKIIKDEEEVRLNFRNRKIGYIGYSSKKGKIIVEGDAGYNVGDSSKGGSIIVEGNAKSFVGYEMEGGSIYIGGNAGDYVGYKMKGGSIYIKGNTEHFVGEFMEGGSIYIKRNAGNAVGLKMKNGSINIEGDVGSYVGREMKGGIIHIGGNAKDYVGYKMEGGSIHIKGDVGKCVGDSSKRGEIRIDGDYESIGENCKAKIYHKGKLIKC